MLKRVRFKNQDLFELIENVYLVPSQAKSLTRESFKKFHVKKGSKGIVLKINNYTKYHYVFVETLYGYVHESNMKKI